MDELTLRRLKKAPPEYDIVLYVTGHKAGNDDVHWSVYCDGEDDVDLVVGILERAIEVLLED